jgi:rhodanese-related sulfurtransferase
LGFIVPELVDTAGVQRLVAAGALLVEVLPESEYEKEHLPGARCIPLRKLRADALAGVDHTRPVVVYCWDYQCDLSARGAARLEMLGFDEVYDYVASKAAWMGLGLPVEGTTANETRAVAIARGVACCAPDARLGDIAPVLEREGSCVITDERGVVLGIVDEHALDRPRDTPVDEAARLAPPTVRPYVVASELAESMDKDHRSFVLVTRLDGTLIGRIDRADLGVPAEARSATR